MTSALRLLFLAAFVPGAAAMAACYERDREASSPRGAWEDDERPEQQEYAYGASTAQATPTTTTSLGTVAAVSPDDAEDTDPTAIETFQPVLSPYGSWVEDPVYGTVWVPYESTVGANFSPYLTDGRWSYSAEGYYWASDYSWGWAPFHYGRWVWIETRGWSW